MGTDQSSVRKASTRLVLGLLQMAGAIVSLDLLLRTGLSRAALIAAVCTCGLTTVSVLFFGRGSGAGPRGDGG